MLRYLTHHGAEAPGAWLVGAATKVAFEQGVYAKAAVPAEELVIALVQGAEQGADEVLASSPGGEQPKFTLSVRHPTGEVRHLLVKYSPKEGAAGVRWAAHPKSSMPAEGSVK